MEDRDHNRIDDLIARYLTGEATPEETSELEDLVRRDATARKRFAGMKRLWRMSDAEKHRSAFSAENGWKKMKAGMEEPAARPVSVQMQPWRMAFRIAAAVAVLAAVSYLLYFTFTPGTNEVIAAGEIITHTLPDNTKVTINRGSGITWKDNYGKNTREVCLEGDAYFEVAQDREKPFVIETEALVVEVVGTSFYVDARPGASTAEVAVTSGTVQVTAETGSDAILQASEKCTFNKRSGQLLKTEVRNRNFLAWTTGRLEFRNTPLDEVVKAINRAYGAEITIEDPGLEKCRLTAVFENQPLEAVVEIVQETFGIKAERSGNVIILTGDGCKQ